MSKPKISVLVGSLRKESIARKIALKVIELNRDAGDFEILNIGDLPLYNEDLETEKKEPNSWLEFRAALKKSDGVLFVTPEYNRSLPGCLKNAIDVGSRPKGDNAWANLPVAAISHSQGSMGGLASHLQLKALLPTLNTFLMPQPEMYLANSGKLMDEKGDFADPKSLALVQKFSESMLKWFERFRK
ncbi:MAG: NAD(P)H-dependent oxidoreductase [Bdellovibrionaceae bacterium]|nr:NAD(P)H-dependent oxidoreductase [Pseudobdellovibrionaceae bacterium]